MLVLTQMNDADHPDRFKIAKDKILTLYGEACTEVRDDFPLLPAFGFGSRTPYGPWYIYSKKALNEEFMFFHDTGQITGWVDVSGIDGYEPADVQKITFKCKIVDLVEGPGGPTGRDLGAPQSATLTNLLTVHIMIDVGQGYTFVHLTSDKLKAALDSHFDFLVIKSNRAGMKYCGKTMKGKSTQSSQYHFNLKPRSGGILGAFYPLTLPVSLNGKTLELPYVMFPHPDLDGKICYQCHRYNFRAINELQLDMSVNMECKCPAKGAGGKGDRTLGKRKEAGSTSAVADFMEAVRMRKEVKEATDCRHFAIGKCRSGGNCSFKHPPDWQTTAVGTDCALGKFCPGPDRCMYGHGTPTSMIEYAKPPSPISDCSTHVYPCLHE